MLPELPFRHVGVISLNAPLSSLCERGYCNMQEKMGLHLVCCLYLFLCFHVFVVVLFGFFFYCLLTSTLKKTTTHLCMDACISFARADRLAKKKQISQCCAKNKKVNLMQLMRPRTKWHLDNLVSLSVTCRGSACNSTECLISCRFSKHPVHSTYEDELKAIWQYSLSRFSFLHTCLFVFRSVLL